MDEVTEGEVTEDELTEGMSERAVRCASMSTPLWSGQPRVLWPHCTQRRNITPDSVVIE